MCVHPFQLYANDVGRLANNGYCSFVILDGRVRLIKPDSMDALTKSLRRQFQEKYLLGMTVFIRKFIRNLVHTNNRVDFSKYNPHYIPLK